MGALGQLAPNLYRIIQDTGYHFQATFIQGFDIPFLWLEKGPSSRSQSEKDRQYETLFTEAWASSISLNPRVTPEKGQFYVQLQLLFKLKPSQNTTIRKKRKFFYYQRIDTFPISWTNGQGSENAWTTSSKHDLHA